MMTEPEPKKKPREISASGVILIILVLILVGVGITSEPVVDSRTWPYGGEFAQFAVLGTIMTVAGIIFAVMFEAIKWVRQNKRDIMKEFEKVLKAAGIEFEFVGHLGPLADEWHYIEYNIRFRPKTKRREAT